MKFILLIFLQIDFCYGGINEQNFEKIQKQIPEIWYECLENTDCKVMAAHCSIPQPLNKNFEKEFYNFLFNKRYDLKTCIDLAPPKWPLGAICKKRRCVSKWK